LFYPHSYQSIPFLSETPDNNSSLLKYATTHATVDRGTAHELRPRLFLFLLSNHPFRSNPTPLQPTPLLLRPVLDIYTPFEKPSEGLSAGEGSVFSIVGKGDVKF